MLEWQHKQLLNALVGPRGRIAVQVSTGEAPFWGASMLMNDRWDTVVPKGCTAEESLQSSLGGLPGSYRFVHDVPTVDEHLVLRPDEGIMPGLLQETGIGLSAATALPGPTKSPCTLPLPECSNI